MNTNALKPNEKFMLTIREAAEYFNIGTKKIRRMAEDNAGKFAVFCGNRYLIIRSRFENYLLETAEGEVETDEKSNT